MSSQSSLPGSVSPAGLSVPGDGMCVPRSHQNSSVGKSQSHSSQLVAVASLPHSPENHNGNRCTEPCRDKVTRNEGSLAAKGHLPLG